MIILIDSGNSRIKLGVVDSIAAAASHPINGRAAMPSTLLTAVFDNQDLVPLAHWLDSQNLPPLNEAWGVNVAGAAQQQRLERVFTERGCPLHWCTAQARTGRLVNGYASPSQLGPDRWASMVGLVSHAPAHHPPFVLASFGTATTIDIVGPDDTFHGGVILPGPDLMARALSTHTADLPLVSASSTLLPTNTTSAIATGVAAAQAGAVLRQFLVAHAQFNITPVLYVTGGGWRGVEPEIRRLLSDVPHRLMGAAVETHVLPYPVLDGLLLMSQLDRE